MRRGPRAKCVAKGSNRLAFRQVLWYNELMSLEQSSAYESVAPRVEQSEASVASRETRKGIEDMLREAEAAEQNEAKINKVEEQVSDAYAEISPESTLHSVPKQGPYEAIPMGSRY